MKADLIIKNGDILSFDLTGNIETYNAAAICDDRIVALGEDSDILNMADSETKIIDACGNTVLPGFCDSHVHASFTTELVCGARIEYMMPEAGENRDSYIARMLENVRIYADKHPEAEVIRAMGWNPAAFQMDPQGLPTGKDLDKICSDRPVLLTSYCHHYIWLNTKALEMTGINSDTKLPYGCIVFKDSEGNPTGMFQEFPAIEMVLNSFPMADYSVEEYEKGIIAYQQEYAFKNGITVCFDPVVRKNALKAYQNLVKKDALKLRVSGAFLADPTLPVSQFEKIVEAKNNYRNGDSFKMDTVKFFFDGSGLEFYLNEPFPKSVLEVNKLPADYKGKYIWSLEQAKEAFLYLAKEGFNIHVHAMGDGAVKEAIDAFEYVYNQGIRGLKHVITHIMLIDENDIKRMNQLGVIAAMQPHWGQYDGFADTAMVQLLGKERTLRSYPMGQLVENGVKCSFATDFPVIQHYNTFIEIQTGMTRRVPRSSPEYGMYDAIPVLHQVPLNEMLKALTIMGAYQLSFDDACGSFGKGKSADFNILDKNIRAIDVEDIENIKINKLIVRGCEV